METILRSLDCLCLKGSVGGSGESQALSLSWSFFIFLYGKKTMNYFSMEYFKISPSNNLFLRSVYDRNFCEQQVFFIETLYFCTNWNRLILLIWFLNLGLFRWLAEEFWRKFVCVPGTNCTCSTNCTEIFWGEDFLSSQKVNHRDMVFMGLATRDARTSVNNGFWGKGVKTWVQGRPGFMIQRVISALNHGFQSIRANSGSNQTKTNT